MRIAVPPNQVGFAEAAGLAAVAYGPDSQQVVEKDFGTKTLRGFPAPSVADQGSEKDVARKLGTLHPVLVADEARR